MRRRLLAFGTLCFGLVSGTADAAPSRAGADVSACVRVPPDASFLVLPVNAGKAFTVNRCLAAQAKGPRQVQLFVNGALPGPGSAHWPRGTCIRTLSTSCAQRYGADLAAAALASVATSGAQHLPRIWWVDVETLNTWIGPARLNLASVRATIATLRARPDLVSSVGIYSSRQQWHDIMGDDQSLIVRQWSATPVASKATAVRNCSRASARFTRGPVYMTQFARGDGVDGDIACQPGRSH